MATDDPSCPVARGVFVWQKDAGCFRIRADLRWYVFWGAKMKHLHELNGLEFLLEFVPERVVKVNYEEQIDWFDRIVDVHDDLPTALNAVYNGS